MILSGEIASDARVEEVEIADRIGVSRTPVREALIALESEGLVRSRPHRGFTVTAADADMVRETYPILCALEIGALRLGWSLLRGSVAELSELNRRLASATTRQAQFDFDQRFHARLTADCGNHRMLELIEIERTRARRFDGAEKRGTADQTGSCEDHARIVDRIRAGDIEGAAAALREHWYRGMGVVIEWLESPA